MSKDEGLNPSISCGYSRPHEPEHEAHAPTGVTDPFIRKDKVLDTANQGLIEL